MLLNFFILIDNITANAQNRELKINTLFLPSKRINLAVEKSLNNKFIYILKALFHSGNLFSEKNMQFYMGALKGRYFDEAMKKWYVGVYRSIVASNM